MLVDLLSISQSPFDVSKKALVFPKFVTRTFLNLPTFSEACPLVWKGLRTTNPVGRALSALSSRHPLTNHRGSRLPCLLMLHVRMKSISNDRQAMN